MAIVSTDEMDRMRMKQLSSYNPEINVMSKLQGDIAEIFDRPDLSTEDKLALIQNANHRFQGFNIKNITQRRDTLQANQPGRNTVAQPRLAVPPIAGQPNAAGLVPQVAAVQPIVAPPHAAAAAAAAAAPIGTQQRRYRHDAYAEAAAASDDQQAGADGQQAVAEAMGGDRQPTLNIVETVSAQYKNKATALLRYLNQYTDNISWNRRGEVILNGKLISNTNLNDLIHDLYTSKSKTHPSGRDAFHEILNIINVPHTNISSASSKHNMNTIKNKTRSRSASKKGSPTSSSRKSSSKSQTGEGLRRPPGKPAKFLHVYKI